jgi:uncharacterized membrane-anchored protein
MNKQLNTFLFIIGATIFNIITTLLFLLLLVLVFVNFIAPFIPTEAQSWGMVIIFIGAIVLSFVVYRIVIRILMKKIDVDKYFTQLFRGKRK